MQRYNSSEQRDTDYATRYVIYLFETFLLYTENGHRHTFSISFKVTETKTENVSKNKATSMPHEASMLITQKKRMLDRK